MVLLAPLPRFWGKERKNSDCSAVLVVTSSLPCPHCRVLTAMSSLPRPPGLCAVPVPPRALSSSRWFSPSWERKVSSAALHQAQPEEVLGSAASSQPFSSLSKATLVPASSHSVSCSAESWKCTMGAEHPQEHVQTHGNTSLTQCRTCEQDVLPEQPETGKRGGNKAGKTGLSPVDHNAGTYPGSMARSRGSIIFVPGPHLFSLKHHFPKGEV